MTGFDSNAYKKRTMTIWNEVAPRYHKRWAGLNEGPFRSTTRLVMQAGIKKGDRVLDIACGTGMVVKRISSRIGAGGSVIGLDISKSALKIAKRVNSKNNAEFIMADAETVWLKKQFDAVTCQYALFFFPRARKVLCNAGLLLKKGGILAVAVHGTNVPFFRCILDAVTKSVPDYLQPGEPDLTRFSTPEALREEVKKSGYSEILVNTFVFRYSPGRFADYWEDYLRYIAKPLRRKIDRLPAGQRRDLRECVGENVRPYTKRNGRIVFPWEVLVLTARK